VEATAEEETEEERDSKLKIPHHHHVLEMPGLAEGISIQSNIIVEGDFRFQLKELPHLEHPSTHDCKTVRSIRLTIILLAISN